MLIPEIREVIFSPEVVEKLWTRHRLSQWEVEAVIFAEDSDPRPDLDDEHGGRWIIFGETREANPRPVYVSLSPVDYDGGVWRCVTAFCPTDPSYGQEA